MTSTTSVLDGGFKGAGITGGGGGDDGSSRSSDAGKNGQPEDDNHDHREDDGNNEYKKTGTGANDDAKLAADDGDADASEDGGGGRTVGSSLDDDDEEEGRRSHDENMARAARESMRVAVGAFRVHGPGTAGDTGGDDDDPTTDYSHDDDGRRHNNIPDNDGVTDGTDNGGSSSSSGGGGAGPYSNDNLPHGIDIMAEATLVVQEDHHTIIDDDREEDTDVDTLGLRWDDEPSLGGVMALETASTVVSSITTPYALIAVPNRRDHRVHDAECRLSANGVLTNTTTTPTQVEGGSSYPNDDDNNPNRNNDNDEEEGGGGNKATEVASSPVEAQRLDHRSVYACGRYVKFENWHLALMSLAFVAVAISIPVAMTTNRSKDTGTGEDDPNNKSLVWTREQIEAIVSPSISHSSTLFQSIDGQASRLPPPVPPSSTTTTMTPQSLAITWLVERGGTNIITGPNRADVEWRIVQRYVLAVLYYSTGGRGWTDQFNYLDEGLHECDWGGMNNGYDAMECNDEKEVVSINLWQNNLIGTIPREIASLNLTTLDFLSNKLQGSIPHELYTLTDISYLNLGYNDFTGTIASELGAMDKLTYLMIDNNDMTGTIPPELGNLTQLTGWLSLEGNRLSGTIPESFAQLTNAVWIYFNYNNLNGSAEFLCDALVPNEAPGKIDKNSTTPLLELWADIDKVECSCCNCCPLVRDDQV